MSTPFDPPESEHTGVDTEAFVERVGLEARRARPWQLLVGAVLLLGTLVGLPFAVLYVMVAIGITVDDPQSGVAVIACALSQVVLVGGLGFVAYTAVMPAIRLGTVPLAAEEETLLAWVRAQRILWQLAAVGATLFLGLSTLCCGLGVVVGASGT